MKKKTGRNEPCPCGSGKKYKKCCYGKGIIISPEMFDKDALKEYEEMMDNWDTSKGQPPTFMEYMGKPNLATESLQGLSKLAEGRDFQSEEELKSFINEHTESKNNDPLDDFLGLSPRQMHYMLNKGFDDNKDIVMINSNLFGLFVKDVPALNQCRFILENIGNSDKGIKATQKGNLPRALVQEFYNTFIRENDIYNRKPMTENDVKDIQKAKYFLRDSGFIKFQKGRYSVTAKGRKMLDDFDPAAFYLLQFQHFTETYNWLYGTGYSSIMKFLQSSVIFCIYLIKQKAVDFVSGRELGELYSRAFPGLAEDYSPDFGESMVISCFEYLFLEDFAYYLGFMDMKREKNKMPGRNSSFKTNDLFRSLFTWKI